VRSVIIKNKKCLINKTHVKYIRKVRYKYKTSDNYQFIYYSLSPIIYNKESRLVLAVSIYL